MHKLFACICLVAHKLVYVTYEVYNVHTFVMNINPKIRLVLSRIMIPIIPYCRFGKFSSANPIGVRATDTITVPYTDIIMNRDSFKDLIFTLRVSNARKSPASKIIPLHAKKAGSHSDELSEEQTLMIAGKSLA